MSIWTKIRVERMLLVSDPGSYTILVVVHYTETIRSGLLITVRGPCFLQKKL